jgi:hypothetical protein
VPEVEAAEPTPGAPKAEPRFKPAPARPADTPRWDSPPADYAKSGSASP